MNFSEKLGKDQIKSVVILLYVTVAASIWKCFSIPDIDYVTQFWLGEYKIIGAFVLFGLIPMGIVKFGFRENLADYGLRFGVPKFTIRSFLVMAPAVAVVAYWTGHQSEFFDIYPFNEALRPQNTGLDQRSYERFAAHAMLYLGYYFGWEFLFRGFLQHGLSERCGRPTALLVQTLASTMLHYGHPTTEVFGSIAAGLVWGFLAIRTKSILSGLAQHTLLGIVLDWTLIFCRE